jgi:hypothetical protein
MMPKAWERRFVALAFAGGDKLRVLTSKPEPPPSGVGALQEPSRSVVEQTAERGAK